MIGGSSEMRLDLKFALLTQYRTQIIAARELKISESRLSHIVQAHVSPNARERETFEHALGKDFFRGDFGQAPD